MAFIQHRSRSLPSPGARPQDRWRRGSPTRNGTCWLLAVHDIDVSDCWVRRSWLAHCAYVAELEAEHATIAARADQQHVWVMIGDDHGVYGAFPPAVTH